jgi:serine/threonine protein phosphatase PrpC
MKIFYRTGWLQKKGCTPEEYEDSFAPKEFSSKSTNDFRCAVADGATETSFSGLWAKILCEAYVAGETCLEDLQKRWLDEVSSRELPWYAEQKLESGAYAAFICLSIQQSDDSVTWKAKSIGDCCLFHTRGKELLQSFPIEDWHDFNNSPLLMASRADRNEEALAGVKVLEGSCEVGDVFFLMSDAISNWFLRRQKESGDALEVLGPVSSQKSLEKLCAEQRGKRDSDGRALMPNDDVTIVRVTIEAL